MVELYGRLRGGRGADQVSAPRPSVRV